MATNNFKSFGIGAGANVTSQADYEALAALLSGFQSGKASSAQINKVLRQSSTMSYVLAQFISDSASVDVLDNGTPATILANLKAAMTALTPGRLLNIQIITATGTYTKTPGTNKAKVRGVGGGGAGGGVGASQSTTVRGGGGGGGGTYGELWLTSVPSTVACTIGAAGVGVNGNTGGNGGTTSFGSLMVLPGGNGGVLGVQATSAGARSGVGGDYATAATGALLSVTGMRGGDAIASTSAIVLCAPGADSPLGEGATCFVALSSSQAAFSIVGYPATGYGAGGGGAGCGTAGAGNAGGNGSPGILIIEEYA